jgi:hypothetical protein
MHNLTSFGWFGPVAPLVKIWGNSARREGLEPQATFSALDPFSFWPFRGDTHPLATCVGSTHSCKDFFDVPVGVPSYVVAVKVTIISIDQVAIAFVDKKIAYGSVGAILVT